MKRILLALILMLSIPAIANATVSSVSTKNTYSCDGVTAAWDYTFPIISASDINVYITSSDNTITQIMSGFSVNTSTKQVTYPTSGTICPSGYSVTLIRNVPLTQSLVMTTQGPFPASSLNTEHDKLTMIAQQAQEQLDRAVKLPITSTSAPTLPTPSTGYSLVWDASGNLVNSLLTGPAGATGPAGPAGSGAGDVLGPATNTIGVIPVWSGNNNKTLSNGWTIGTSANNIVQLTAAAKLPAVDGSLLTNVTASVASVSGASFTSLGSIPSGAGSIPAANITSLPDSSLATIATVGKVSGAALTSLGSVPFAAGQLPSANLATVAIAQGGTGQITAPLAINALLPAQGSANGKFLTSNGTTADWGAVATSTVKQIICGTANFLNASRWASLSGGVVFTAEGVGTRTYFPIAGTLKNFYANGAALTLVVYKNNSATLLSANAGSDTTHTVSVSVGDYIEVYASDSYNLMSWSVEFDPS